MVDIPASYVREIPEGNVPHHLNPRETNQLIYPVYPPVPPPYPLEVGGWNCKMVGEPFGW